METWISKIMSTSSYIEDNFKEEYENLLVQIIGFSSLCQLDKMVDPHEFSKEAERKLTAIASGIQGENEENRKFLQEENESTSRKAGKQKSTKSDYLCYMLTATIECCKGSLISYHH